MKRIISLLLSISIIISVFTFGIFDVSSKKVKNSYRVSDGSEYIGKLLYAGGKYIFSSKNGIFVKKSPKDKLRKVVSTKWLDDLRTTIVSDGQKAYFVGCGPEYYYIFKTNLKGKYSSFKRLSNMTYSDDIHFITVYKNKLYYRQLSNQKIYQLDLKTKKTSCVSKGYKIMISEYHNGYIYFSNAFGIPGGRSELTTRRINLKNNKISKVLDKTTAEDYCFSDNKIALWNHDDEIRKGEYIPTKSYIYTIGTNNKKIKSKKLPDGAYVQIVDSEGKYAIIHKNGYYYKFILKTGKKYNLSKNTFYYVKPDMKSGKTLYFINNDRERLCVKKLKGNKLVTCKIDGKKTVVDGYDYWVSENYLFVSYDGGKLRTFKIK